MIDGELLLAQASISSTFADVAASGPLLLGVGAALLAGIVSFASPCVVPLVPGYMSYLAGLVGGEMENDERHGPVVAKKRQGAVALAAALFVLGFSTVFMLGTVSVFGMIRILALNADLLTRLGGIVTIVMGVVFLGFVPFLQHDTRFAPRRWTNLFGAPLLGGVFALGWTPCLGPTLAAIISVSAGTEGMTAARGALLVLGYCMGLGLPFVLMALGSARAVGAISFLRRHSRLIQIIGGTLMIIVGVLLLSGMWNFFIGWTRQWTVEFGTTLI